MQIEIFSNVLNRLVFDVTMLILSGEEHGNQCRPFPRIDRRQVFELRLGLGTKHSSFPFQCAFFPHVDISGENRRDEKHHFRKPEKLQLAVNDGPGEKKDGFNIEEKKRSEEHTSELQSLRHLVCRLL